MKRWLTTIALAALTLALGTTVHADPPVVALPAQPPAPGVQKDGPFRLLVAARSAANRRRAQGYHAETVRENHLWWVVYYR